METGFFGGMVRRRHGEVDWPAGLAGAAAWHWAGPVAEGFLRARGPCCRLFDRGAQALLIRGHVVDTWSRFPADLDRLADKLHRAYLDGGQLALDGLEGSYTLALLDALSGRLLVYRNLVGNGYTYYHETPGGLLLGSNLADLVEASGASARTSLDDLPTFFLNRNVPGRHTLFTGFHRILPGEQLEFQGRTTLTQRHTLADLDEGKPIGSDALDRLDDITGRVCAEHAAAAPGAANLLSGGVDSSFLQVHFNRVRPDRSRPPVSYCVRVDHPRTRLDADYALSAARSLGTSHVVVEADEPYGNYLLETLAVSGEAPNHVQLAYYHRLACVMRSHGVEAGLCAEAADSLFGLALANKLQNAAVLRRLCPTRPLRRAGEAVARLLGWTKLSATFRLADHLHDYCWPEHPVNNAAVFADRSAVEACFGTDAVAAVAANRRALLDHYGVPATPLDRLHGAGFLGSAMNTASLTTTLFNCAGLGLYCLFLDSRLLRLVVNLAPHERFRFRKAKELLKRSLARHGQAELAYRHKLGFGQPIFEWLGPGGPLRPPVERIDRYDFVDRGTLEAARARPGWFLYSLLCFDLWHKMYVARTLPRSACTWADPAREPLAA